MTNKERLDKILADLEQLLNDICANTPPNEKLEPVINTLVEAENMIRIANRQISLQNLINFLERDK